MKILFPLIAFMFTIIHFSCIKYYDDGFSEDVFSKPSHWYRGHPDKGLVFVNDDNELELNYNDNEWINANYYFPFYISNGVYEIIVEIKAIKQLSKIIIYDYTTRREIIRKIIRPSRKYMNYSFEVAMPNKGHSIGLCLIQNDYNETGGKLLIRKLKINYNLWGLSRYPVKNSYEFNFTRDVFLIDYHWYRWQADEKQAFINKNNELQLSFTENKWISAYFDFPFYKSKGLNNILVIARAESQAGRISIYDFTARETIASRVIGISNDYIKYSLSFRMPEKEDHIIWLRFLQANCKKTGGKLLISRVRIN